MLSPVSLATCPHCAAPRVEASECPRCGVIYAKVHQRGSQEMGQATALPAPPRTAWHGDLEDAELELRLRMFTLPIACATAWLVLSTSAGRFLARTFFTMIIHEIGHAVTAWLSGFIAFPLLWFTPIAETRSNVLILLLAGGLGFSVLWLWNHRRRGLALLTGLLLVFQMTASLLLSAGAAKAWIIFGGDAGCIVLGALLMATFYSGRDSAIHRNWLRWGFLVLGAFAFFDAGGTWWRARGDVESIPFGEIEGLCLSDPSQLTETYGWSVKLMVSRYVWLIGVSALALLGLYVVQLRRARQEVAHARTASTAHA